MRTLIWCGVLAVLLCAGEVFAADATQPPPGLTSAGSETVATPPPSEDVTPLPQVPQPPTPVPTPVAPSEPPTGVPIPPPVTPVPEGPRDFIYFTADVLRTTYEVTTAEGNVTARYRDIVVTSQKARADYKTNIATFEGNVVLRIGVQEVRGERIELNMKTREWSFISATSTITPSFAQGYLLAPVFVRGGIISGIRDRQANAYDVEATTCNLPAPHYELVSRALSVYPDDKIVLRDTTFSALGRKLFSLKRFVVPLRQIRENPNLLPTAGQTAEEGFFLKTAYSYMGNKSQMGFLTLDLMTRKGIGQGLRHTYAFPTATGEVNIYHVNDRNINQNTFTGRLTHTQKLGTVLANLTSDFRSNSYLYAPQSKTMLNRLSLTRDRTGARSSLVLDQSINNVLTRTSYLTGYLRHTQNFGPKNILDTNFDYNSFTSQSSTRARLTSQMLFSRREEKFDWNVSAQKLTDLSDEAFAGGGIFAGIERLPELAVLTDSARLGKYLPFHLPATLRLSYGRYNELPANLELDRTYLNIATPVRNRRLSRTWNLAAGGGFRQFVYSNDTAQYSFDASALLMKRLGDSSAFELTYRYQKPRGFTPYRFDFIGRYNTLNASLDLRETERLKLSLLTGYNFEQKLFPWQDVVLRAAWQPTRSFLLYTATSYDINTSKWRTLINQVRVRGGGDFKLDVGTRYDTVRKKLATVRALLDTPIDRKTRLQAVAGYNGFTKDFDYRSIMLTRDLHCWEASLVFTDQGGFYKNRGIMLNFRIKAFPLFQNFGMGPFGQALDTSVGQVY